MDRFVRRFCIKQDGNLFSLFSIEENRDGTVAIYTATEDNHEGFSEGFGAEKLFREVGSASQRKFSVHPSIGRDGITITHQVILGKQKFRSKLLVASDLENLVARVCTYFCPLMNDKSAVKSAYNKDDLIEIARFSKGDKTSIVYSIVVTGRSCRPIDIPGFQMTGFTIGHFNFGIYVSYLNLPAADVSVMNTQMTFSPQIDGKPIGTFNMIKSPNEEIRFLPDSIRSSSFRVAERAIDIYLKRFPTLSWIGETPLYFHPTLQALRNGRAIRGF